MAGFRKLTIVSLVEALCKGYLSLNVIDSVFNPFSELVNIFLLFMKD